MPASQPLVAKMRANDGYFLLCPNGSARNPVLLPALIDAFEGCFANQQFYIMLNLEHVRLLSSSFIAVLLEMTGRARRAGGDVIILNLSAGAKSNLLAFSAHNFLTINSNDYAVPMSISNETEADATTHEVNFLNHAKSASVTPIIPRLDNNLTACDDSDSNVQIIYPVNTSSETKTEDIQKYHLRISSQIDMLYQACSFVTSHAERAGMSRADISRVKISIYEACLNVIEHAYRSKPNQWIEISVAYNRSKFIILILDKGIPNKSKEQIPDFDIEVAANARKTGGMGMHIIRRSMDVVKYESDPIYGNKLILIKYLHKQSEMTDMK